MNTKNKSKEIVEKLAALSINPFSSPNEMYCKTEMLEKSLERKASREYTIADLVPIDDLAFHWLQATTFNNDVPAWFPDTNVMSYLDDFIPKRKTRLSANADIKLNSSSEQEFKTGSGFCRVPDVLVYDSGQSGKCEEKNGAEEKI